MIPPNESFADFDMEVPLTGAIKPWSPSFYNRIFRPSPFSEGFAVQLNAERLSTQSKSASRQIESFGLAGFTRFALLGLVFQYSRGGVATAAAADKGINQ
jgi:hypothetical protein